MQIILFQSLSVFHTAHLLVVGFMAMGILPEQVARANNLRDTRTTKKRVCEAKLL